jgi:hypothetical protein
MSDVDDILNAPTQEELEARLLPWTAKMMRKWQTVGISEMEGQQLLLCWKQKEVGTAAGRQRTREQRFEQNGKLNGLQYAALVFEKDVRTIRRWCEKGYFPGATRTQGKHWRIPVRVVEQVRRLRPKGFGRGNRSLFGTAIWKQFKKDLWLDFGKRFMQASAMEAALQDKSQSEFHSAPVPFSSRAIDTLKIAVDTGQTAYTDLKLLARRLYREDPSRRIDYKLLAATLRIAPSTLYRRYSRVEIRSAIKAAKVSLGVQQVVWKTEARSRKAAAQRQLTSVEDDAAVLKEMFSNIVKDGTTPSPFIEPSNRSDDERNP